mgnify:FL=1
MIILLQHVYKMYYMNERKFIMSEKNYYSKETEDFANESMRQIKSGAVRNHKLKNSARIHTGEMEEVECDAFCNFLMSKNYFLVDELRGCENA